MTTAALPRRSRGRSGATVDLAGTAWPLYKLEALAAGLLVFVSGSRRDAGAATSSSDGGGRCRRRVVGAARHARAPVDDTSPLSFPGPVSRTGFPDRPDPSHATRPAP